MLRHAVQTPLAAADDEDLDIFCWRYEQFVELGHSAVDAHRLALSEADLQTDNTKPLNACINSLGGIRIGGPPASLAAGCTPTETKRDIAPYLSIPQVGILKTCVNKLGGIRAFGLLATLFNRPCTPAETEEDLKIVATGATLTLCVNKRGGLRVIGPPTHDSACVGREKKVLLQSR